MPYDLDPNSQFSYDQQRRSAMRSTLSNLNSIGRSTSQLDANYGRNYGAAMRAWDQQRAAFPRSFNQRGLMTSGIYNRAAQNFDADRQDAFGQLAQTYYNQRAQLADQANNARGSYEDMYGSIADQEQLNRAQIAAALRGTA